MEIDIKEKIKNVLRQETYSESDIVYLLVETRKFLELNKVGNDFDVLRFYRNWACHSELTNDAGKIFNKVSVLIMAREYVEGTKEQLKWDDLITEKIKEAFIQYSFPKLGGELKKIFDLFCYNENFNWQSFRTGLYEIIQDTPLSIKKDKREIFKFECKKVFKPLNFDDLEIHVTAGVLFFTFALDDRSLETNPSLWFQSHK
jgi:hypothetical protein